MQIIDTLKSTVATSESMFTRQLCKEDIVRLERLLELAHSQINESQFAKHAYGIGWTPGDLMTHELKDVLEPLFAAVFAYAHANNAIEKEKAVNEQWSVFDTARRKRLMRCT